MERDMAPGGWGGGSRQRSMCERDREWLVEGLGNVSGELHGPRLGERSCRGSRSGTGS